MSVAVLGHTTIVALRLCAEQTSVAGDAFNSLAIVLEERRFRFSF